MMVSDAKKAKTDPAPKKESAAKKEPAPKKEDATKSQSASDAAPAKTEGGEKADAAPSGYSRGEGQKPVSQAYKDNWNAIFAKKPKNTGKREKKR
jgi:hypothetical protein